jgi:intracellular sulfur oxidation DsrE/DsrF family protein
MTHDRPVHAPARRSFLSRLVSGAGAFGAAFAGSTAAAAQPATAPAGRFVPAKHAEDEWLDDTTAKHRFFYDTMTAEAGGQALFFARNFFVANASGYKLTDADLAQVICLRHASASFGFTDAMWAKYGDALSARAGNFLDPKTKQAPTVNVYQASGYGEALRNVNVTIDQMATRGVRFAVCGLSTRATAQLIAQKTGATVDTVMKELASNLVPNARIVPAGIVTVSRAQERGYTFAYVD